MRVIVLFLLGVTINAQNLVPNPSFENYNLCPDFLHQINRVDSWNNLINHYGTPDFFHACSLTPVSWVPINNQGSQPAVSGNGYVGIITYQDAVFREYIQAQLISPLTAGQTYFVSFYVSCAENGKYASNNIGAIVTTNPVNGNGTASYLNLVPHVWSQTVISSTTEWTLISGTYIASGGEQYITIGNFFNDAATQKVVTNPNATSIFNLAYYYVDQVTVSTSLMGNNQFNTKKVIITPNPVDDEFTFTNEEYDEITQIELYNQYSKIKDFDLTDNRYNIKELPSGIYYLLVTYKSKESSSTKLIKL